MSEKIMRYLVPGQGPNVEALKRCIALAVKLSQENGFKIITFLVPAKSNFERSIVADLFGQKVMNALLKGKRVKAIDDIYFELESVKTFREYASKGLVRIVTKKPLVPGDSEREENLPSRSAKFRVAEKI